MPGLARFLLHHCLVGFTLAFVFVGFLLWKDVGRIATLAGNVEGGWIFLGVATFFIASTFASVQMGMAVMLAGAPQNDDEDGRSGGGRRERILAAFAAPAALAPVRHGAGDRA